MIPISKTEALRYLGYGKSEPDIGTLILLAECMEQVQSTAQPKYACRRFSISRHGDTLSAGPLSFNSRDLEKSLAGCDELFLFAATLGMQIDILLNRYQSLDLGRAAVFHAVAAAAIEGYCNSVNAEMAAELLAQGLHLRPRYSPGYGDLPLSVQPELLSVLDAKSKLGITLSETNLMTPEKSITAVIGIAREPREK